MHPILALLEDEVQQLDWPALLDDPVHWDAPKIVLPVDLVADEVEIVVVQLDEISRSLPFLQRGELQEASVAQVGDLVQITLGVGLCALRDQLENLRVILPLPKGLVH